MSQNATEKGLFAMGLVKQPDGSFRKPSALRGGKHDEQPDIGIPISPKIKSKVGRPMLNENPIEYHQTEDKALFILHGVVRGLNGGKGLIREHWTEAKRVKAKYVWLILSVSPRKWVGKVKISVTRYSTVLMDRDNLVSTSKHIFDALVLNGVIENDSPDILTVTHNQEKCGKNEQRYEFIIEHQT